MYEFFDFDYENAIFEWDDEEHPEEERYDILGRIGKIIFVVCTFKTENVVHIISARRATEPEKVRYEHGEDYDE